MEAFSVWIDERAAELAVWAHPQLDLSVLPTKVRVTAAGQGRGEAVRGGHATLPPSGFCVLQAEVPARRASAPQGCVRPPRRDYMRLLSHRQNHCMHGVAVAGRECALQGGVGWPPADDGVVTVVVLCVLWTGLAADASGCRAWRDCWVFGAGGNWVQLAAVQLEDAGGPV
jgi:hypothetical protein